MDRIAYKPKMQSESTKRQPAYLKAARSGLLSQKVEEARKGLSDCVLCPRKCHVDRVAGQTGVCKTGANAWISSYNPHFGEESPLVGENGSGTIFITHCSLKCNFCQNFDISHESQGFEVTDEQLAALMLSLQHKGCHNINFVTPSHVVPQILSALQIAAVNGLVVPLVYNSSGYDRISTLKLLDGIFDIYMPDFKFWDPEVAHMTCQAENYPEIARQALKEMHRQVGDLSLDDAGIARRGLLIRHLVMPQGMAGTPDIMAFIAEELSQNSYVNIMPQYRPMGDVDDIPALCRGITREEYASAIAAAKLAGIMRLDKI